MVSHQRVISGRDLPEQGKIGYTDDGGDTLRLGVYYRLGDLDLVSYTVVDHPSNVPDWVKILIQDETLVYCGGELFLYDLSGKTKGFFLNSHDILFFGTDGAYHITPMSINSTFIPTAMGHLFYGKDLLYRQGCVDDQHRGETHVGSHHDPLPFHSAFQVLSLDDLLLTA